MREITYHNRDYLRSNNLVMNVDEEQVHFINGIAAVNATVHGFRTKTGSEIYSGIINEEYQEVFDDEVQYGDIGAIRHLMFLGYNTNILRCGENDFVVTVRQGDEYHCRYAYKHIRIMDMKATLINEDIGEYIKTNDGNILITGGLFNQHGKKLYNVIQGKHIGSGYSKIDSIDGSNQFYVVKRVSSRTKENSKGEEDLCLTDDLHFQIDSNGHIISRVLSSRKGYLNYGDADIDNYPMLCRNELIEESESFKKEVYSLKRCKTE